MTIAQEKEQEKEKAKEKEKEKEKKPKKLPRDHDRYLFWHDAGYMTPPEIARKLGVNETTVRRWVHEGYFGVFLLERWFGRRKVYFLHPYYWLSPELAPMRADELKAIRDTLDRAIALAEYAEIHQMQGSPEHNKQK